MKIDRKTISSNIEIVFAIMLILSNLQDILLGHHVHYHNSVISLAVILVYQFITFNSIINHRSIIMFIAKSNILLSILYVLARKSTPLTLLTPLGESSRIGFLPPQNTNCNLIAKVSFKVSAIN